VLEEAGFQVTIAVDGEAAWEGFIDKTWVPSLLVARLTALLRGRRLVVADHASGCSSSS
jgi:hypothetical protein